MGVPAEELEKAMDAEFAKVREGLVPQLELEKLKAQLETEFVRDNSRVAGVASNLATAHTFLGGAQMATRELERYLSVTPEDLQRVAKEYFSPDARVVLHYLPKNQKP